MRMYVYTVYRILIRGISQGNMDKGGSLMLQYVRVMFFDQSQSFQIHSQKGMDAMVPWLLSSVL